MANLEQTSAQGTSPSGQVASTKRSFADVLNENVDNVTRHAEWWQWSNRLSEKREGPLWVALGDSFAQGLGAEAPDQAYVGHFLRRLRQFDDPQWRVINLSKSGATTKDVVDNQLDELKKLSTEIQLITCVVGATDLLEGSTASKLQSQFGKLIKELPGGSIVATLPQEITPRMPLPINHAIRETAAQAGILVADLWIYTAYPWRLTLSADRFHPSSYGYTFFADALQDALGLQRKMATLHHGAEAS